MGMMLVICPSLAISPAQPCSLALPPACHPPARPVLCTNGCIRPHHGCPPTGLPFCRPPSRHPPAHPVFSIPPAHHFPPLPALPTHTCNLQTTQRIHQRICSSAHLHPPYDQWAPTPHSSLPCAWCVFWHSA